MRRSIWVLGLAILLGVPAGVGAFTFIYARGFSYLSTDPRACANCHVMHEQYDGWLKSGHRHTATCVDCHLPAHGLAKWVAKADHGFRHSTAFTLQNFKEPIEITPHDLELVQENCVRCHATVVHAVAVSAGPRGERLDCMHCHAGAGHGAGG
ncbi:MAG: cytochrome c nitrite reductase small subunit [Deltaproteobacteria bacterium]|nr:cytochrome c nitrite reductase small subunit [Deltaproteobacteria bacterium]